MGFLAALLGKDAISALLGSLLSGLEPIFRDYINGKISKEQMAERSMEALLSAFADVEKAYLDSLTKTYTAFIQVAAQNPAMTRAWSFVLYSQLFVLFWHQMIIPGLATIGVRYASSGATVDWAYALVALCLGAPAIASRVGPAAGWAADNFKKLIGK